MYLFYLDESGNTGADLAHVVEPIHWLVAVGVTEHQARDIESDLLVVAIKYFRRRAYSPDFEFHGADIYSGRREANGLTPTDRVALYRELLEVVDRHKVRLWVRGIHKDRHMRRAQAKQYNPDHPYRLGFMYLIEAIDLWLDGLQPAPALVAGGREPVLGLLVSDEQDEVSRDLVSGFARWRQFGTDHGYRARDIKHLIDTIHYVKSQDSWLIQLVDCIAYIRNRLEKAVQRYGLDSTAYPASEKAVAHLWQLCQPRVVDSRIWP